MTQNTENKWDYNKFLAEIDVVVMGRKCYDQNMHKDFQGKEVYIASSEKIDDYENYHFISDNICESISKLKNEGKSIFLFGGGGLVDNFVKADIIDEYVIGMVNYFR